MVKNIEVVFGKGTVKGQKRKKNVFDSIIETLLDMLRKSKDG
jgi:hypothetical protein